MTNSIIQIHALTRCFGDKKAVDNLTLTVEAGEIFGLLGHNGAGKTTTVRLLNGVLDATSGSATVMGFDPVRDGAKLRAQTGVLTETPSLDERLSGRDNLTYYADLYNVPVADVAGRVNQLLDEFDLSERAADKVGSYSKGMKQRLALARSLLHRPVVLFLDEPTSGLDPVAARHVNERVEALARREGCTVFICTHNLVDAQKLCDRVAVMEQGQLVAMGTPTELTRQYVRRLDVELEVDQMDRALAVLEQNPLLVTGTPRCEKNLIIATLTGREAIPELLAALLHNEVRIYRLAPQDANLEEVYFALHGERQ